MSSCLYCILKHNVSETGFYLRHQLGPIDRASPYDEMMDNVQERNNCTNLPSSKHLDHIYNADYYYILYNFTRIIYPEPEASSTWGHCLIKW
jgi:hypothetical protein